MDKLYHCIILSTKSAGSSALQMCLAQNFNFNIVDKTQHHENETLFWAKAASVLGMPQEKMHRSVVPYAKEKGLEELSRFCLQNNINKLQDTNITKEAIFSAYRDLVFQNKPRFVEKSPHHLFNKSNLDLIGEFMEQHRHEIDFKVLGLVRHPLSVIYSGWERWRYNPEQFEQEWFTSNKNLLDYQEKLGIDVVRYEDLVMENAAFIPEKLGLDAQGNQFRFRRSSLDKWKSDSSFGHELSPETKKLAASFGYSEFGTAGESLSWKFNKFSAMAGVEIKRMLNSNS